MKTTSTLKLMLAAMLAAGGSAVAASTTAPPPPSQTAASASDAAIAGKVIHEIRMYPRYTIFDHVAVSVRDGHVDLQGQVSLPFKKGDMGRLAQHVAGVEGVTNEIEVLPTSLFDDRLRLQIARSIYRAPELSRYAIQAIPPIHIIVDNGHVTLYGVVNNNMEKQIAGLRASQVGLSFGPVVNNLKVENPGKNG